MKRIVLFLTVFVVLILPYNIQASVAFCNIEVETFKDKGNDEYLLVFQSKDKVISSKTPNKDGKFKLHIRFNARCITKLLQSSDLEKEKADYLKAIEELKGQIAQSKFIVFGMMSGIGFHPIPSSPGEYQCDNLSVLRMKGDNLVYSIHSDIKSGYCNGK